MAQSQFTYVIYIRTTLTELWHALTTANLIKKYWFGMNVESTWKVGATWRMSSDEGLMDSGEILEHTSEKKLVLRWLNEWNPEFKAEGNSRCVFETEPMGEAVKFTITHSVDRMNSKFIEAVSEGWPMILSNLKSLLETGKITLVNHPGHGN